MQIYLVLMAGCISRIYNQLHSECLYLLFWVVRSQMQRQEGEKHILHFTNKLSIWAHKLVSYLTNGQSTSDLYLNMM